MHVYRVSFEAHGHAATIYVVGWLCEAAALRSEEIVRGLAEHILTIRVDLRGVDLIDPEAFVRLARALGRWRDSRGGRVTIEFPARSERRAPRHLRLADQPNISGTAVSTAIS